MDRHICLLVNDLEKELHFYRDLLECKIIDNGILESEELAIASGLAPCTKFKVLRAVPPNSEFMIQIFKCLESITETVENQSLFNNFGFHHIGIEVANVEKTYDLLKSAGIKTISSPVTIKRSGTKLFFALDPDGNKIEIFQLSQDQNRRI